MTFDVDLSKTVRVAFLKCLLAANGNITLFGFLRYIIFVCLFKNILCIFK